MSGISGFSNQKKLGGAQFASVQATGSDKFGLNTAQMYLFDITPSAIAITGVTQDPVIVDKVWLEIVSHGAKVGDVIRFTSNADALFGWELDVVDVLDSNTIAIHNIAFINNSPSLPSIGEMVKTCRWVTAKADSEGALTTSSGPAQFIKNGATQTVAQDTVTPANNNPLPAGLYIIKDGVVYPVNKDTGNPANTVAIPVEVSGVAGPVNITAGDLNVQLTDLGANFDAARIGDGSGVYLLINPDGSINVNDASVLAELQTLKGTDFATSAKQDLAKAVLDSIKSNSDTLNLKDFSTAAKQDLAKAVLDAIKSNGDTLNLKDFSTSAKQDLAKAVLDLIQTNTAASATAAKQDLAKAVLDLIKTNGDTLNAKDFATSAKQDLAKAVLDNIKLNTDTKAIDSIVNVTTTTASIVAPAGAKGFIIQNSTISSGALRWGKSGGTVNATNGFYLGQGQSTSYIDAASSLQVYDVDGAGIDAAIVWFK